MSSFWSNVYWDKILLVSDKKAFQLPGYETNEPIKDSALKKWLPTDIISHNSF